MKRCPHMPGFHLVPGYFPALNASDPANATTVGAAVSTLSAATSSCVGSGSCAGIQMTLSGIHGNATLNTISGAAARLQAAVGSGGSAAGGCAGTYVRSVVGGLPQWLCAAAVGLQGTVLNVSSMPAHLCADACAANSK